MDGTDTAAWRALGEKTKKRRSALSRLRDPDLGYWRR
jgi:hypothetical protein